MIGRIAITLCVLAHTAIACPSYSDEMGLILEDASGLRTAEQHPHELASAQSDDAQGLAVAIGLMGLSTLIFAITRRNAVRRTFATSRRKSRSNFELLQAVARVQRPRAALFTVASGAVLAAVLASDLELRLAWSVTPALLFAIGAATWWRLQRLLALRAHSNIDVVAHGFYLFVVRGGTLVSWLAAPPWHVSRAGLVPVATVRA